MLFILKGINERDQYRYLTFLLTFNILQDHSNSVLLIFTSAFFHLSCLCSATDDHSRVVMEVLPDEPHSDYINASIVKV